MFDFILKLFNTRAAYHVAGGVMVAEIIFTLLKVCGLSGEVLLLSAIAPLLIGICREIRDYIKWHEPWIKYVYDIGSWSFGGCIWVGLKLLQM